MHATSVVLVLFLSLFYPLRAFLQYLGLLYLCFLFQFINRCFVSFDAGCDELRPCIIYHNFELFSYFVLFRGSLPAYSSEFFRQRCFCFLANFCFTAHKSFFCIPLCSAIKLFTLFVVFSDFFVKISLKRHFL